MKGLDTCGILSGLIQPALLSFREPFSTLEIDQKTLTDNGTYRILVMSVMAIIQRYKAQSCNFKSGQVFDLGVLPYQRKVDVKFACAFMFAQRTRKNVIQKFQHFLLTLEGNS